MESFYEVIHLFSYSHFFVGACSERQTSKIVTIGFGEVEVMPNEAVIDIDIKSKKNTVALARQANAETTQRVKSLIIDKLKMDKDSIITNSYNLGRNYRRDKSYNQVPEGFVAQHDLQLKVSDFKKIGDVIDTLGVFSDVTIDNPNFNNTDIVKYQAQALEKAVSNARKKAMIMVKEAGRNLGEVVRVHEGSESNSYLAMNFEASEMKAKSKLVKTQITPDKLRVSQSVTVTFELN